ncbi:hypothetical protein [Alteraurantiacibacter aquimixticola]|uniref:Uncharacterized protein n=1 Tax=Alteraurantiacibacter aquimixticola TaxID=2489173 RepID=A0A4T3F0S0_9SPHN|nr:hypothetical protein [Alteraurantiacibacter aquimixticola]TIX50649.1 hypothetical protein E5222_10350 [Alteraurantiacibacter aquimixticola]
MTRDEDSSDGAGWSERQMRKVSSRTEVDSRRGNPSIALRGSAPDVVRFFSSVSTPPPLFRVMGFGGGLYGWLHDARIPAGHVKLYFLTALWLPVIPVHAYAVTPVDRGFRFHASINLFNLVRAFRGRVFPLYLTALIEGVGWLIAFGTVIALVYGAFYWLRSLL